MLSSARYEAVLDFLDEALSVEGAEPFPEPVLGSLRQVVPCDALSYREWSPTEVLESGLAADDPAAWESVWPAYLEVRHEDPLPGGTAKNKRPCELPDGSWLGRPLSLAELLGERRFRHSGLYAEMCRPLGVRTVMKLFLPTEGSSGASFVFDTSRATFTDDDRDVLLRVVPHLLKLRRNAHARRHHTTIVGAAADEDAERLRRLTPREQVVLARAADGATNAEIAAALFIGGSTVRKHLEHIYEKLEVKNRAAASALYVRASRS